MNLQANQLFSLEGKTALLTGASGFLGRTFAIALLANGARVVALGRSDRLEQEAARWTAEFGPQRVRACRVDMHDRDALERTLDEIVATEPFVEILVNNAHELGQSTGFNVAEGALEKATPEQLMRNLAGGTLWPLLAVQKLGKGMKDRRRGSIINIATMYALVAPSPRLYEGTPALNPPGYSAAKAAMMAFMRVHGVLLARTAYARMRSCRDRFPTPRTQARTAFGRAISFSTACASEPV